MNRIFNYSTGPVELSDRAMRAMASSYGSSHMPAAQEQVAETLQAAHRVLGLTEEFVTAFIPGSIRQALELVIGRGVKRGFKVLAVSSGYWGSFLANLASTAGAEVILVDPLTEGETRLPPADIVLAVHVETEFGDVQPIEAILAEAHRSGAITIVDAACSIPIEGLDYSVCDIIVLGSHKCLGGPPGLGILGVRKSLLPPEGQVFSADWALAAYLQDAHWKLKYARGAVDSPSPPPPLVTYPIQVVAGLHEALLDWQEQGMTGAEHREAARTLRRGLEELGLRPYRGKGDPSSTVVRADLDRGVDAEWLRAALWDEGFFVIGNIGGSAGGSIRIGTMSGPQLLKPNIERLLAAIRNVLESGT